MKMNKKRKRRRVMTRIKKMVMLKQSKMVMMML